MRSAPECECPRCVPHFVEVTRKWDEIVNWHSKRREETDNQISKLEMQLRAEIVEKVHALMSSSLPSRGLKLVGRSSEASR